MASTDGIYGNFERREGNAINAMKKLMAHVFKDSLHKWQISKLYCNFEGGGDSYVCLKELLDL